MTHKSFGNQHPELIEHHSFVPSYPKTHKNGCATVVELSSDVEWTKAKIQKLKSAMQYTLTGGRGEELVGHVEYFEIEGLEDLDIPMNKSYRRCAGVKV